MAKRYIWDFNAPAGNNLKTWDEWETEQAGRSLELMNAVKSPGIKTYKPGELDLYDSSITPEHIDKNALLDALSTSPKPSLVKRIEDSKAWRTIIGNPEEGYGVGDMAEAVMMANPYATGMAAGKGLQGAGTVLKKAGDPAIDALKAALSKTPTAAKKAAGVGTAVTGYETIKGATDPEYADRRDTLPSQFGASLRGGVGDTVKLAGSAAEWQGKDKLAATLKQAGADISEGFDSKQVPFTWKSWFDPDWYANNVARTIPTTAALIPAMVIAYKGGAKGAAMRGFGKFGQAVIGSLAGAAASRPLESALEAGNTYEDAISRGLSVEEAEAAAQKVYEANLSLAGLDAAQLALAFAPQGKLAGIAGKIGKTGVAASKLAGVALTEAGEEGYQQAVQQSATGADQRGILAQMLNPNTEMKESMAIGGLFGVGMGGAGVINDVFANPADLPDRIQQDVAANLPPELKTQVAQNIENFMDQGMDEAAATEKALDELAETPEGQEIIASSTQTVANEMLGQAAVATQAPQAEQIAQPQQETAEAPAPSIVYDRATGEPLQVVGQPNPEFYIVQNQASKRLVASIGDVTVESPATITQEAGQSPAEEINVPPQAAQELVAEATLQPQPQVAIEAQQQRQPSSIVDAKVVAKEESKEELPGETPDNSGTLTTTMGELTVTKTKHTQTGADIWVVKPTNKLSNKDFAMLNTRMRKLGGAYSRFTKGFNFKEDPADKLQIIKEPKKQTPQVSSSASANADITAQAKSLREQAARMQKTIDEKRNPAIANQNPTARRASIASNMALEADRLEGIQSKLNAIADAIESGNAPEVLHKIKRKTHIEALRRELRKAQSNRVKVENIPYSSIPKMPEKDIKYAWLEGYVHPDHLKTLLSETKGKPGTKEAAERVRHMVTREGKLRSHADLKVVETLLSKLPDNNSYKKYIKDSIADFKRILEMGITTDEQLQEILKAYLELGESQPKEKTGESKIKELERNLIGRKIEGYFPTPKPVVDHLIELAEINPGMDALEPSAGKGNIADALKKAGANVDVVEIYEPLRQILEAKGYNIVGTNFLDYSEKKYDRIVMNPPFEKGQDIDHVKHALELLKPGGRVVAIMSEGPFFRGDKKATTFRDWLEENEGTSEKLPEKSFTGKDSDRQTGVAARVVVLENPEAYNETKDGIKFLRGDGDQTAGGENTDVDSDRGRDTDSLHSGETERIVLGGQNDEAAERRISDLTQALRRIPDEDFRTDELRAADAGEYEKADVKKAVELAGTYGAEVFLFRWEKPGPRYFSATLVENVIYIDADSNESSLNAVAHELIHYLKRNKPNIYKTIRDAAFQHVTVKKFVDYKQAYSVRGYEEEDILEELVCDIGAQVLLKSTGMEGAFFTHEEWNNLFGSEENASKAEEAIGKALAEGTVKDTTQKSPPEGLKPKLKRETGAKAPIFYSQLRRIIEQKMPNRTVAGHVLAIIKGGQAKQEEVKWSGIEDWLKEQKGRVEKQDVLGFLSANEVQVEEMSPDKNKYDQYQLPGGDNYRELLFTLPRKIGDNGYYVDGYSSSHWDEANVLAHVRFNDRTTPDGQKVLFIEEIQSDWHQEGRKKGYALSAKEEQEYKNLTEKMNSFYDENVMVKDESVYDWWDSKEGRVYQELERRRNENIPDAPFKTTWHEFVLKRILRHAAENGYDRIAFTTGEQQAERYDLSKQVGSVTYNEKTGRLRAYKPPENEKAYNGGLAFEKEGIKREELADYIGKDPAMKLLNSSESQNGTKAISGLDLKIGGSGMKGFYDRMIPAFLNKYAKKWGSRVETSSLDISGGKPTQYADFYDYKDAKEKGRTATVPSLPITDAMRESVLYLGQPMFKREGMTLQELSDELGLTLKPAREAMLKPSFHAANTLAKIFTGKDIVLFRGKGIQGATIGNTIFLNEKVKSPVLYVVKHEIIHALGNTDPESYAQLLKIAKEHFDGNPAMFKHYEDYGYAADEAWDEFTSDVVSEIMESDGFWAKVREKAPELVRTIIDIIDNIIAQYKKAVSKKESMLKHIQDMEEFKAKVAGVTAEALARRQQGTAKPGAGGEVAAKTSLKREKEAKFTLPDQEVQERIEKARGVPKDSLRANIVELLSDIYKKAHREFEHLPRTGEFAELRNSLLNLRKQKGISADKTLQILGDVTKPLNEYEYDVFSHKVIFDDLAHEFEEGNLLPFGLTEENFSDIKKYIDDEASKLPKVQQAIEKRKAAWKEIKDDYIEAQQAVGFNVENRLKKEDYYHHQVLEYANKKGIMGTGKKLRIATGRGFLKQRGGSSFDINSDYLQAEFEVMAQMMQDAAIAKTLKVVKDNHDIVQQLKREAVRLNDEAMLEEFARILEIMKDTETTPEQLYKQTLNKKQAIAFGNLYKMAARGELPEGSDGKYRKLIEAMAKVDNAEDFPENHRKQLWQYLNYLAGNENENEQSQIVARTIFKGRAQKMKAIKNALGKDYVTWEDIVPEGYTVWQPREGHMFYMANSIPQGMAEQLFYGIMDELKINADMLKKEMVVGHKYPEFVIKNEVALTLEELYSNLKQQSPVANVLYFTPYRAWKQWQLISPRRYFRYNTRNMTGDLDAVLAGNPSALRPGNLKKAWGDLWQTFFVKDRTMSPELRAWFERGGFETLMQCQEINDINRNRQFRHLMESRMKSTAWEKVQKSPVTLWNAYWDFARTTTDFREALLRYACYLDYAEQMEKGNGKPKNFGASNQDEIMALRDPNDRATKLANELMGAYDEVSVIGTWLADHMFPFWRWNEVNFVRYSKLFRNAYRDGKLMAAIAGKATGIAIRSPYIAWQIGKFLVKAAAFTAMISAWNWLFFNDEDKELPEDIRNRVHIVLGRDKDGKVLYFSRLGALQDFVDWFGLDTPIRTVQDFLSGRKSAKEIAVDWAKADANKVINALTPIVKTPGELLFDRKAYPDAFEMMPIRDRWQYLADSFGLGNEYKALAGKPSRGYVSSISEMFLYKSDPYETAFFANKENVIKYRKKIGKYNDGYSESIRSEALYNIKLAMRYGDKKAFEKYLLEYVALGGTSKGFKQSMKSLEPLYGLSKDDRAGYIMSLDAEGKENLLKSIDYYQRVVGGQMLAEED